MRHALVLANLALLVAWAFAQSSAASPPARCDDALSSVILRLGEDVSTRAEGAAVKRGPPAQQADSGPPTRETNTRADGASLDPRANPNSPDAYAKTEVDPPPSRILFEEAQTDIAFTGPNVDRVYGTPTSDLKSVVIPGGTTPIQGDKVLNFAKTRYTPVPKDMTAQQVLERELGAFYKQKVRDKTLSQAEFDKKLKFRADGSLDLGKPFRKGGENLVWVDPIDPKKVVKIMDPSLQKKPLTAVQIAMKIQRDDALMAFYKQHGKEARIRVAESYDDPYLKEFGIRIQENVEGTEMWNYRPDIQVGPHAELDAFDDFIAAHENRVIQISEQRYGMNYQSTYTGKASDYKRVGTDLGGRYSNVKVDETAPDGPWFVLLDL